MNSRIILSTADFSANNIGKYVELSDLTKKVLAKQTQYEEESTQAIALNTFLNQLTEEGFIGGENPILKYLVIPSLAANGNQLMYNIAHLDSSGYPTNEVSAEEISAEIKAFNPIIDNEKIIGCKVGPTSPMAYQEYYNQVKLFVDNLINLDSAYPDMSVCVELLGVSTDTRPMIALGAGFQFAIYNNEIGIIASSTNEKYVKRSVNNLEVGFVGMVYDSSNFNLETVIENGTVGALDENGATSIRTSKDIDFYNRVSFGQHIYDTNKHTKFSALAIGRGMSTTQLNSFKTSLHTLLNILNG